MNRIISKSCTALALAGALVAGHASAAPDCGPQASGTSDELPVATLESVQNSDKELVGVMNPDGSLTVFQLVPFVVVPDAAAQLSAPSNDDRFSAAPDAGSDVVLVVPAGI